MSLTAAVRLLRAPELARSDPHRLRTYLLVNAVAVWTTAFTLVVLRLTVLDSPAIVWDAALVIGAGLLVLVAQLLAGRGRTTAAAVIVLGTNWVVAVALTWATPFIAPVGLLALLVPLVIVADHIPAAGRTWIVALTVPLSGVVAFLGEYRRQALSGGRSSGTSGAVLVGVFTAVVVLVLVVGLRDYVRRLGRRTRELEESRARVAGAALEARRSIERSPSTPGRDECPESPGGFEQCKDFAGSRARSPGSRAPARARRPRPQARSSTGRRRSHRARNRGTTFCERARSCQPTLTTRSSTPCGKSCGRHINSG